MSEQGALDCEEGKSHLWGWLWRLGCRGHHVHNTYLHMCWALVTHMKTYTMLGVNRTGDRHLEHQE